MMKAIESPNNVQNVNPPLEIVLLRLCSIDDLKLVGVVKVIG